VAVNPSSRRGGFDPYGNPWFGGATGSLVELDAKANRIREYWPPTPYSPYTDFYEAMPERNREVWAGVLHGREFVRFNPATGRWREYACRSLLHTIAELGLTTRRIRSRFGMSITKGTSSESSHSIELDPGLDQLGRVNQAEGDEPITKSLCPWTLGYAPRIHEYVSREPSQHLGRIPQRPSILDVPSGNELLLRVYS
jgi:hypothetical protein